PRTGSAPLGTTRPATENYPPKLNRGEVHLVYCLVSLAKELVAPVRPPQPTPGSPWIPPRNGAIGIPPAVRPHCGPDRQHQPVHSSRGGGHAQDRPDQSEPDVRGRQFQ